MDTLIVFAVLAAIFLPAHFIRKRIVLKRMGLISYRNYKFVGYFRANTVSATARKLGDEALLGAYHLPDTREKAKPIIRQELLARGYDDKRIADWRRPISEITAPPAAPGLIEPVHYFRMMRVRRRMFAAYRFVAIVCCILGFTLIVPILGMLVLLPVAVLAAVLGRNRVVRILLLRPFGAKEMTRPLKRVVLRDLGAIGVVFTLADRNYKPSLFLTVWSLISVIPRFLIAPVARQTISFGRVSNEVNFTEIVAGLTSRLRLGFGSFLNGGQAYTIHCSDPWWRQVIDLLMHSCEIIVMDVSRVSQGSSWEIHRLEDDVLIRKCLFIVQEAHLQEGQQSMARLFAAGAQPELFLYDEHGIFKEPAKFHSVLEDAVAKTVAAWGKPRAAGLAIGVARPT
jgi:hypothetical protein